MPQLRRSVILKRLKVNCIDHLFTAEDASLAHLTFLVGDVRLLDVR